LSLFNVNYAFPSEIYAKRKKFAISLHQIQTQI
jgi:hypothetical protein